MSIATEITRLQGIKTDIRTALVTQGIAQASSHNMADFSADILAIQGGSEGVYITVTCESAYQGYDIILSANESELDRKQCPSSSIVNFFVSADNVTLPTTFTISNNHPDYSGMTQVVSASMYGWYEIDYMITRTLTLYSRESGFADGYSLDDFVKLYYASITIDSNKDILVTSTTKGKNGYSYIPIDLTGKIFTTLHFSATSVNYGEIGYKISSAPTDSAPTDQKLQPYPNDGNNKDDLSFNISGMTGILYIVICGSLSSTGTKYTNPINKIWLD